MVQVGDLAVEQEVAAHRPLVSHGARDPPDVLPAHSTIRRDASGRRAPELLRERRRLAVPLHLPAQRARNRARGRRPDPRHACARQHRRRADLRLADRPFRRQDDARRVARDPHRRLRGVRARRVALAGISRRRAQRDRRRRILAVAVHAHRRPHAHRAAARRVRHAAGRHEPRLRPRGAHRRAHRGHRLSTVVRGALPARRGVLPRLPRRDGRARPFASPERRARPRTVGLVPRRPPAPRVRRRDRVERALHLRGLLGVRRPSRVCEERGRALRGEHRDPLPREHGRHHPRAAADRAPRARTEADARARALRPALGRRLAPRPDRGSGIGDDSDAPPRRRDGRVRDRHVPSRRRRRSARRRPRRAARARPLHGHERFVLADRVRARPRARRVRSRAVSDRRLARRRRTLLSRSRLRPRDRGHAVRTLRARRRCPCPHPPDSRQATGVP